MSPRKVRPLTLGEHYRLGRELHAMRDYLTRVGARISNRYGGGRRPGRLLLTALEAVDKARCEMDEQLLRDHRDNFCPDIYYPGPEDRRDRHAMCEKCSRAQREAATRRCEDDV